MEWSVIGQFVGWGRVGVKNIIRHLYNKKKEEKKQLGMAGWGGKKGYKSNHSYDIGQGQFKPGATPIKYHELLCFSSFIPMYILDTNKEL